MLMFPYGQRSAQAPQPMQLSSTIVISPARDADDPVDAAEQAHRSSQ